MEQNSTQLNELYTALYKAQSVLNPADKDSVAGAGSYKYNYANLAAVMGVAQEALCSNGLCFSTRIVSENHITVFYARLAHSSGQYLESRIEIGINLQDVKAIQELGKAITYLRRYTFSMMVGVVTEEDDDAQSLVHNKQQPKMQPQVKVPDKPTYAKSVTEFVTSEQLESLEHELKDHEEIAKAIIEKYGSLKNMPKSQFLASIDRIRSIKRLKE